MTESNRRPGLKSYLGGAAALALSGACLYLFARGTDWTEVWHSIARAKFGWLVASFLATWLSVFLRGVRWRVMLLGVKPIRLLRMYNMEMVGVLGNGLFPARIGEVARCLFLAKREAISVLGVFASVIGERLLDLVMVGTLLVASINLFDFPPGRTVQLPGFAEPMAVDEILGQAGGALGVLFAALVLAIAVLLFVPKIDDLVRAVVGRASERVAGIATGWLASFRQGLGVFRRPLEAAQALLWTAGVWGGIAIANYCMFPAFDLDIGLIGALLLTSGLAVSVALPQAPGFLGVFQLAVTLILVNCFDAPEADAKAIAIILWVIQLFGMVVLGFVSLAIEGVALGDIWRSRSEPEAG